MNKIPVEIRWGEDGVTITLDGSPLEVLSAHHDNTFKVRYQGEVRTVFCSGSFLVDGQGDLLIPDGALSQNPYGFAAADGPRALPIRHQYNIRFIAGEDLDAGLVASVDFATGKLFAWNKEAPDDAILVHITENLKAGDMFTVWIKTAD